MLQKLDLLLVNAGGFRKKIYQNLSENLSAIGKLYKHYRK